MPFLIGTDEAGYGPNLGPLVVAASAWRVAGGIPSGTDLDARLVPLVVRTPGSQAARGAGAEGAQRPIVIADSKQLHRPGGDLKPLARGVHEALLACGHTPRTWRDLLHAVAPEVIAELAGIPWHADDDVALPDTGHGPDAKPRLSTRGLELVALRARLVFPPSFNAAVRRWNSKGTLLSLTTLELVADLLRGQTDEQVLVVCDKHGGRSQYAALLQGCFSGALVRVAAEGRALSAYEMELGHQTISFRFQAGGESWLPSALASMLAKYLRELSMQGFNRYWQTQIPGIRATAGYPVDAARFRDQIRDRQRELGITDDLLWRDR